MLNTERVRQMEYYGDTVNDMRTLWRVKNINLMANYSFRSFIVYNTRNIPIIHNKVMGPCYNFYT